jgi:hypothetical protein
MASSMASPMAVDRYAWVVEVLRRPDLFAAVLRCDVASRQIIDWLRSLRLVDKEWKAAIDLVFADNTWLAPILRSGCLFVDDFPRLDVEMKKILVDVHLEVAPIEVHIDDKMRQMRYFMDQMSLHLYDRKTLICAFEWLKTWLIEDVFSDQNLSFVLVVVSAAMQVHKFDLPVQMSAVEVLVLLQHVSMGAMQFQATGLIAKIARVMRSFSSKWYVAFRNIPAHACTRTCICIMHACMYALALMLQRQCTHMLLG